MGLVTLINSRIIDRTGKEPIENGTVVIEAERIKEVLNKGTRIAARRC